jgi:monoamine oxidase
MVPRPMSTLKASVLCLAVLTSSVAFAQGEVVPPSPPKVAVVPFAALSGDVPQRAGQKAVVLEARDRVGGRTLNHPIGDGKVVEVGGQWIGPGQDRMAALAREMKVDTFRTHSEGENVIEFHGKLTRYRGTIPRIGPHVLADVAQAQFKIDRLAKTVPLDEPWTAPKARKLDSQTFEGIAPPAASSAKCQW